MPWPQLRRAEFSSKKRRDDLLPLENVGEIVAEGIGAVRGSSERTNSRSRFTRSTSSIAKVRTV